MSPCFNKFQLATAWGHFLGHPVIPALRILHHVPTNAPCCWKQLKLLGHPVPYLQLIPIILVIILFSVQLFSPFGHVFVSWIDDTTAFVSLKDRDWSNQVMNNFKSNNLAYRVQTYEDFVRSKENGTVSSQNCGITPTLEKTPFNLPPPLHRSDSNGDCKKRHLAEENVIIKRHKSVTEEKDNKTFDEPGWD